ncbi:MAG: tetratricopeptide repeat protein, partial [Planctomycetes bacterium]|nr:tetratricopeptide repeat protein [Planctomycetota bacterium]
MRKEQLVLILTAGALGWLVWSSTRASTKVPPLRPGAAPALERPALPDVELAMPQKRAFDDGAVRELFAPPSDTRPLPPLDFQPPPMVALAALRPPALPAPEPKHFGRFLRAQPVLVPVPDLFVAAPAAAEDATPTKPAAKELTSTERAERVNAWKKLYDWYRSNDFKFGRIANDDRYRLGKRANEPLLFVEVNPETGAPKLPGQPPVQVARNGVQEYGFADTAANKIEVQRVEFGDPLPASQYDQALFFAAGCVEMRHETPRALEVAEELFTRASAALESDPLPRLGRARVYEAGFQFEKAFQAYQEMLAGAWSKNALVMARLADLEARFRMFDKAEERLFEAERAGRTLPLVQATLGRFLTARGRADEAVEHLRLANQHEPTAAEAKRFRAQLRCDLGDALLASGVPQESAEWFEKAKQADATDARAQAGAIAAAIVQGNAKPSADNAQTFELLLANGVAGLASKDAAELARAKDALLAAAALDPMRAVYAWRALSWLAEITGNPEEALRFVEQAYENDPTDAWTLYQRGRVQAARDDLDGAIESFQKALDQELDFPDALAALGELMHRKGRWDAAEKYLERAMQLDPKLAGAIALRGMNFIRMVDMRAAEDVLRQALAVEPDHPTARNALAWCWYAKGGPTNAVEAETRLRELDDARRGLPESDAHRVWARGQIERIQDHLEKVVWSDRFERKNLLNGWDVDEKSGPQTSIHDGVVTLSGAFKQNGRARVWQSRPAGAFVAIEAKVTVKANTTAKVGLFVSRETQRGGESQIEAELALARPNDPGKNGVQWRAMKRGSENDPWTDVPAFEWKFDQPVTVRIERMGDAADARIRVLFDGFPIL